MIETAINTPKEFIDFVRSAPPFDLSGVKPWERDTLAPYLGYPEDWPANAAASGLDGAGASPEDPS